MGVVDYQLPYYETMPTIYYVPGRGGRLNQGLGLELSSRGYDLMGREIAGPGPRDQSNPFASLSFQQQVQVIQHDLKTHFWTPEALVIGNSFGAYLIAHSILQLGKFPGKCLFLSPVLGAVKTTGMLFKPPKSSALKDAIETRSFPSIILDIVVGSSDEHFVHEIAEKLGQLTVGAITIFDNEGHRLSHEIVKDKLDHWLPPTLS
jgi:hypothetical protein